MICSLTNLRRVQTVIRHNRKVRDNYATVTSVKEEAQIVLAGLRKTWHIRGVLRMQSGQPKLFLENKLGNKKGKIG